MAPFERISKIMSRLGICSRREADEFLKQGWVYIDGKVAQLGQRVSSHAEITLDPQATKQLDRQTTIILNKPVGYVSSQPEKGYVPAIKLITEKNRDLHYPGTQLNSKHLVGLAVAGRLDIDSRGLLIFTQDGRLAKKLIGPNSTVQKKYQVGVSGTVSREVLAQLRHGLCLDGKPLKPAKVEPIDNHLQFILTEGRKRQLRRMCEAVGLKVTWLKRIQIGQISLGELKEGAWRYLHADEEF